VTRFVQETEKSCAARCNEALIELAKAEKSDDDFSGWSQVQSKTGSI
jgi:hypothetical protein